MQSPREEEQRAEVKEVFDKFAANGKKLSEDKIVPALRAVGRYITSDTFRELTNDIPSGGVEFDDFLVLMTTVQSGMTEQETEIAEAFASLDEDRSGTIRMEQFVALLVELGGMLEEDAENLIEEAKEESNDEDIDESRVSFDFVVRVLKNVLGA